MFPKQVDEFQAEEVPHPFAEELAECNFSSLHPTPVTKYLKRA
jgi:hypothetical protein